MTSCLVSLWDPGAVIIFGVCVGYTFVSVISKVAEWIR